MSDDNRDDERSGWGREGTEPEIFGEDEGSDPAAAFEPLRRTTEGLAADLKREMTTIHKGVEAGFDQFERQGAAVDYSAELGRMTSHLASVAEHMQAIEKSPILRQGPEHYGRVLERSGEGVVRTAVLGLEQEGRALKSVAQVLADQTDSARERRHQDRGLVAVGGARIVTGVLLTLFTPWILPFSAAPRVASTVMGQDAWQAGMSLLTYASPDTLSRVAEADKLVTANKQAIVNCRQAAAKLARKQTRTIIVAVPEKAP